MADAPPNAASPRASLWTRARNGWSALRAKLGARQTALLIIGGFGLAAMIAGGAFAWFLAPKKEEPVADPVQMAIESLDTGDVTAMKTWLGRIPPELNENDETQARVSFALGVSLSREASGSADSQRGTLNLLASTYLSESHIRGGVPGREYQLLSHWARALHETGKYGEALAIATNALTEVSASHADSQTTDASEVPADVFGEIPLRQLTRIAAESALRVDPPRIDVAAVHVDRLLAEPELEPSDRSFGQQLRAEVMLAQGNAVEAGRTLDEAHLATPQAALLKYRIVESLAKTRPDSASDAWRDVLQQLRKIGSSEASRPLGGEIRVAMAQCQRHLGDEEAALSEFARTRQLFATVPAGLTAAIEEAEILAARKNDDQASKVIVRTVTDFITAGGTLATKFTENLRDRIDKLRTGMTARANFDAALALCDLPPGIVSAMELTRWRAETFRDSAIHAEQRAQGEKPIEAEKSRALARQRWRLAGKALRELAANSFGERRFLSDLQASAEAYLKGRDFLRALEVVDEHAKHDSAQEPITVAMIRAEAELSLGRPTRALETLQEFIARYPTDPNIYRARVIAANAARESGDLAAARDLLLVNLTHNSLSPRSLEWRDSQFLMGELWFDDAQQHESKAKAAQFDPQSFDGTQAQSEAWSQVYEMFDKAALTFEVALGRYPEAPQADKALFLLGESHRRAAERARRRLAVENLETGKAARLRELRSRLEKAVAHYDQFIASVHMRGDSDAISRVEQAMIRNSFFAKAGCLYDLERWEDAVKVYSTATSRWQYEPEALEAYVQLAACYRRLGRAEEATSTLEQAKVALERIPADQPFQKTTRFSRDQWRETLDWLSRR